MLRVDEIQPSRCWLFGSLCFNVFQLKTRDELLIYSWLCSDDVITSPGWLRHRRVIHVPNPGHPREAVFVGIHHHHRLVGSCQSCGSCAVDSPLHAADNRP